MTLQELTALIDGFKSKTKELKEQNPYLKTLEWYITDVPYPIFKKAFEQMRGKSPHNTEMIELSGKVYFRASWSHDGSNCDILVWSVPVKVIKHIEVIEEELQTQTA